MSDKAAQRRAELIAAAAQRIAYAFATNPTAQRVVVYRTDGGAQCAGQVRARVADRGTWTGDLIGVYTRDVTIAQLVEDIAHVDA